MPSHPLAAQRAGTIEGALIGRVATLHTSLGAHSTFTGGLQLSFFVVPPIALEADGSVGVVTLDGIGRSTVRPVAVRAIGRLYPWTDTRLIAGIGYTWLGFARHDAPGAGAGAPTLTVGIQRDVTRLPLRLRLDGDVLYLPDAKLASGTTRPSQLGGVLRVSVALRAPRGCCP